MLLTNHAILRKHIKTEDGKTPFNMEEKREAGESFFFFFNFPKTIKKSAKKIILESSAVCIT